jgi:hypothetical protein
MPTDRIAEIRKELATLREELRQAEAREVVRITERIDFLLAELTLVECSQKGFRKIRRKNPPRQHV